MSTNTTTEEPKTFAEAEEKFEQERLNAYALAMLGASLVASDSHDTEEGGLPAFMTEDRTFYFSFDVEDPVMTSARIGRDPKPTGRFRVVVECVKCTPGNHMEPDDYDLDEVCRADDMHKAIEAAAHVMLEWKAQSIGESLFYEKERKLEPYVEKAMREKQ